MMPPRNWLAAVLALRMRPQSNEPRKRLTRGLAGDGVDPHLAEHRAVASASTSAASRAAAAALASTLTSSRSARARIDGVALAPLRVVELAQARRRGRRPRPASSPASGESLPASLSSSATSSRCAAITAAADRRGLLRAAGQHDAREVRVAVAERRPRPSAGPAARRRPGSARSRCPCPSRARRPRPGRGPSRLERDPRRAAGHPVIGIGGGGAAHADQPLALAPRRPAGWLRWSHPKRSAPVAVRLDDVARGEGQARRRDPSRARCGSAARSGRCPAARPARRWRISRAKVPTASPGARMKVLASMSIVRRLDAQLEAAGRVRRMRAAG